MPDAELVFWSPNVKGVRVPAPQQALPNVSYLSIPTVAPVDM